MGRLHSSAPVSFGPAIDHLDTARATTSGVPGTEVTGMLVAAYAAVTAERAAVRVEPMVTGPQSAHVPPAAHASRRPADALR